jgi:hypothetical protein
MTRGKEGSKTKRGTHWQRKQEADAINDIKKNNLEEKRILKKQRDNWKKATKEFRKKLQLQKAQRVHYSQLETKQKEILIKIESGQYSNEDATRELNMIANNIISDLNTQLSHINSSKILLKHIYKSPVNRHF